MTDPLRSIMDLFAKSPFKPLNEHAEKVKITVLKMDEAVKAYCEGDEKTANDLCPVISALEHDADDAKHAIREHLPSSLIMSVDRTDILSYLKQQDDVANSAEFVAQMLSMKMVKMPAPVKDAILNLNKEVVATVEEHVAASDKVISLLESAFSSKNRAEIQEIINRVDTQKHNVDVLRLKAMKIIYTHESELGATGVYHLIELVKELGWVADHAESSSDRLRIITARR